ncbi:hypothetical protein H5410_028189 [Solanum commersonii]|uniref:Replication factor A C-terminal domain-containing protein n=1 Tax=Solanum commersonii TaxID=4109 RepID=A0A9J5Z1C8_SOLCO|nr:hypothetical protein H5410_028189 [Solanum commersonii]
MHNDLEVAFINKTEVVEDKNVVYILLKVKSLNGEGRSIRRKTIATNDRYPFFYIYGYDRKVMTLWGDFAEIEGQMLQTLESEKPMLVFCDVKSSIYQGDFVLSTTPISSLLINPQFEKANNFQQWNDSMKAQKIDISLMPSRLMQTARQVKITNILNGSLAIVKDMYYKFNATVFGIDNNTDPYATCTYCGTEDIDYEERYRLKIDVTDEDQFLRITLFDAAQYYLGCDVKDYVHST